MAYGGKILRLALQEFEKDRAQREASEESRRERIFQRQPRLREIERELCSTMSRIITGALRRGTDPGPAIQTLGGEAGIAGAHGPAGGLPGGEAAVPALRRYWLPERKNVPLPAAVLRQGTAEGAEPDAGSGQPKL